MQESKGCTKCQVLPIISSNAGKVLFSCEVPEILNKSSQYLKHGNYTYTIEDAYTLFVDVDSFEEFLKRIFEEAIFATIEQKSIRILYLEHGVNFSPSHAREIKTLAYFKDLIGAKELSTLINKGALTTHFQPIVDLHSHEIYGYESLARGVEDDGSLIYPDTLFTWAREGDMLFYLDRACRESSLKTAAVKNIHAKVFINFIPTAIYDPTHCLISTVRWAKQLDFDPQNIVFEVVESDRVDDVKHLKKILDFYKSKGFMVALDDMGSGYSSLNLLAQLLPDIVKIDRAIIDHIDTNPTNQSIFKAIVSIAKENNILVLAEGVERKEEVTYAVANGAQLAQGYYFGKPNSEPVRKLHF